MEKNTSFLLKAEKMKKLLIIFILFAPLLLTAQQPKMHIKFYLEDLTFLHLYTGLKM